MMEDMKNNINNIFNLEEMVVSAFTTDPQLLNDLFIKCGYEELAVIRDFAAWMGFSVDDPAYFVVHLPFVDLLLE